MCDMAVKSLLQSLGPSAITGVGSIANSLINYQSQRENRQLQIDLMREQNQFQKEMQNSQNLWNSEGAKMQRLQAAGLNPAIAFGDAQNTSSVGVNSAPTLSAPQVDFSDVGLQAAQAFATVAQGSKDSQEAKGVAIDNMTRSQLNMKQLEMMDSQLATEETNRSLSRMQRRMIKMQRDYLGLQYRLNSENYDLLSQGFRLQNEETNQRIALMRAQEMDTLAAETLKYTENEATLKHLEIDSDVAQATISNFYSEIMQRAYQNQLTENEAIRMWFEACRSGLGLKSDALAFNIAKSTAPDMIYQLRQHNILLGENIKNARFGRGLSAVQAIWNPLKEGANTAVGAVGLLLGGKYLGKGISYGKKPYVTPNSSYGSNPLGGYYY